MSDLQIDPVTGQHVGQSSEKEGEVPDAVLLASSLMFLGQGCIVGFILLYSWSITPQGYAHIFIPMYLYICGFGTFMILQILRGQATARWLMLCYQLTVLMTVYKMWGDLNDVGTFAPVLLVVTCASWWISIMVMFYSAEIAKYFAEGNPFATPIKSKKRDQIMSSAMSQAED